MKISFIIPAFNEKDTLPHTLANLEKTVNGFQYEIIVVDDHSDDELSEHLQHSDQLQCVRNNEKLGVAKARNVGATHATGDLLIFLDAHMCFSGPWLHEVISHSNDLADAVIGAAGYMIYDADLFREIS